MKVNFLIVGTQKGGSSALTKFIRQHPQIGLTFKKEGHFFDNDDYFQNEEVNYSIYHKNWEHILLNSAKLNQCKIYGEKTPTYMYWKECMERIKEYNHEMKLIFILRNPIDRAYSQWNMNIEKNREFLSFSKALYMEKIRILTSKNGDRAYSYIKRGYYSQQIKRIMKIFSPKQMLFLKTEDLKNNHQETLDCVFNFLEVDTFKTIEFEMVNSCEYPPMDQYDREFLRQKFAQEIVDLENLLGWDLSNWKM